MKKAVVQVNSKQYIVSKGDEIKIDGSLVKDVSVLAFWENDDSVFVENADLKNFNVLFEVLKSYKGKKVPVRRFKSKSKYRKNKSHRQPLSVLKITDFGKNIESKLDSKK